MSDEIARQSRLAVFSGDRGSMVLITERRHVLPELECEVCSLRHVGCLARGIVLDEPAGDMPWLLWTLDDGWSQSDHGAMAACPNLQSDPYFEGHAFF